MTSVLSSLAGGAETRDGFATLGSEATYLLADLDHVFATWGERVGAAVMTLPPVLGIEELAMLDVYRNFPHMSWVATTLAPEALADLDTSRGQVAREALAPSSVGLPSAVCYGVYVHLRGRKISERTLVTAVGTCFRNETHYDGLRRLGAFRMREIVALGSPEHAGKHVERFDLLISQFGEAVGLDLNRQVANDPFFDPNGPAAQWQKLAPVKHEYRFGDLAIASVNEHRKFFGERCGMRVENTGDLVSTSCVAFGLERWTHALFERYGEDWSQARDAVRRAAAKVQAIAIDNGLPLAP